MREFILLKKNDDWKISGNDTWTELVLTGKNKLGIFLGF
jgi:hypothetical protein